jgi:hypothetical protein
MQQKAEKGESKNVCFTQKTKNILEEDDKNIDFRPKYILYMTHSICNYLNIY